jgi:hypothetical protein
MLDDSHKDGSGGPRKKCTCWMVHTYKAIRVLQV